MVYVVERYLPGLSRADLLPRLSRLEPVIEELRGELLVQPTSRSGEMSTSTSIPRTAGRRRSHVLVAIAAIAAIIALAAWATATHAVGSAGRSARSSVPTRASVLGQLTPAEREYVLGIMSMTPAQIHAAFGTSATPVQGRDSAGGRRSEHSGAPTDAFVLRSLPPQVRRYVLGIMALTPLQFWAAFGTTPMPPGLGRTGTTPTRPTTSPSVALPILPACSPGSCWHAAPGARRPARDVR